MMIINLFRRGKLNSTRVVEKKIIAVYEVFVDVSVYVV